MLDAVLITLKSGLIKDMVKYILKTALLTDKQQTVI
jgi:hypothetical protein